MSTYFPNLTTFSNATGRALLLPGLLGTLAARAQGMGIGTPPDGSARLDVSSTTQGLLPRA